MVNEEQTPCPEDWMSEGQTDYKRSLAYRRLGIRPEDVQPAPFFALNLKRIARCITQGARKDDPASSRMHPLDYLGFSEDPVARKVLDAYRSVPASYRRLLPPEAFCHAAGVSPSHVLEVQKPNSRSALSRPAAPCDYRACRVTGQRPNDHEHCGARFPEDAGALFARPLGREAEGSRRAFCRRFRG